MDERITLAEALNELRQELYTAQDQGTNEQFRFEVEQAELTLEVEFRRDGNGKVNVEVGAFGAKVAGEAGGALGSTLRQTLTLTLQVHDEALGGERAKIRRRTGGLETPADGATADGTIAQGSAGVPAQSAAALPPTATATPDQKGVGLRPWEV
ncbi:trypco2 family protein [Streptomyces sp. NPDC048330]|uniref:trypco2 family protein n=1 Tax=Streptomyces sp. NPDC048330 TaxID=3365533 RepID=UPI0037109953